LFLFEASTALWRAGTQVAQEEGWKEQVQKKQGIVLSRDGMEPEKGNETRSLLRDVLTGRRLHAEKGTPSPKERFKPLLAPVLALKVAVIGGISDAHPTQ
jgi:hypothetical protein